VLVSRVTGAVPHVSTPAVPRPVSALVSASRELVRLLDVALCHQQSPVVSDAAGLVWLVSCGRISCRMCLACAMVPVDCYW